MGRRGENKELKRVDISGLSKAERDQLVEGLRYAMIGIQHFDKYWKRISNAALALKNGRDWLTTAQYRTAQFFKEKFIKEMAFADSIRVRKGGKL